MHLLRTGYRSKNQLMEFIRQLFVVMLVTFLLLELLETVFPGSVSSYLNLQLFMALVFLTGILRLWGATENKPA